MTPAPKASRIFTYASCQSREQGVENRSRLVRPKPCHGLVRSYFGFSLPRAAVATRAAGGSAGLAGAAEGSPLCC